MVIRSSVLAEFKLCPRRAHYAYDLGLFRKGGRPSVDLVFGKAVHKAVEIFHKVGSLDSALQALNDFDIPPDRDKNIDRARLLVTMYVQGKPLTLVESEKDFSFKIGRHVWKGRFDGIADVNGALYVVEHKTTKPFYLQTKPNDQFIAYWGGARITNKDVQGVIINNFDVERCEVRRILVSFSWEEFQRWREETKLVLSFYQRCKTSGIFPKSPFACKAYGRECSYRILCTADLETRKRIIEDFFETNQEAVDLSW